MIPIGFPPVAPSITLGDLFGPLAPLALVAAVAALVVLIGLLAGKYAISAMRRGSGAISPSLRNCRGRVDATGGWLKGVRGNPPF
jgi:hypothetical protein